MNNKRTICFTDSIARQKLKKLTKFIFQLSKDAFQWYKNLKLQFLNKFSSVNSGKYYTISGKSYEIHTYFYNDISRATLTIES